MASRSAKAKSHRAPKTRHASGRGVAWAALAIALVALGLALSEKPWVQGLAGRLRSNWQLAREEIREQRRLSADEDPAARDLREAERAAEDGDAEEMLSHLREVESRLRTRARDLDGTLREAHRRLVRDVSALVDAGEAGAETARQLSELAERTEALRTRVAEATETDD